MDYQLEHLINGPAGTHPLIDALMEGVAGGAEFLFLGLIAVWFLYGWVRGRAQDRQGALTAFVAACGALTAIQVINHLWHRPRPFLAHPDTVHLLIARSGDPSFPSDHAAAAFAIAVTCCFFHRRLGLATLAVAALLAYARVYVGAHYPTDVLAGAALGALLAWLLVAQLAPLMTWARALVDRLILLVRLPLPS